MPGPNFVLDKGYQPTGAVTQFKVVVRSTTNKEQCAQATVLGGAALGICQDDVTAARAAVGRVADIRIMGISRAIADAAIGIGVPVRAAADGRVTALAVTTANQELVGITQTASGAANDQIDILLTPGVTRST